MSFNEQDPPAFPFWRCDECPSKVYLERDFQREWATLRRAGWTCHRDMDGAWSHYCGTCNAAYNAKHNPEGKSPLDLPLTTNISRIK
jgi:hypothetical protein